MEKNQIYQTFTIDRQASDFLKEIAHSCGLSLPKLIETICLKFIAEPMPGEITVNKQALLKTLIEVMEEAERIGAEGLKLKIHNNKLNISILESGGLGCIDGFDTVEGLTEEEILEIP